MRQMCSVQMTVPATTPVELADAKRQVRRIDDDDNDHIELVIAGVVSYLDGINGILGRALITQDWADIASGFPASQRMGLVLDPVQQILSVSYYDSANQQQTLDAARYALHSDASGCYMRMTDGSGWPATYDRDDAVTITYRAGYGDAPADVPGAIRLAILDLVAHRYLNREAVVVGTIATEVPRGVAHDLRPFTRAKF